MMIAMVVWSVVLWFVVTNSSHFVYLLSLFSFRIDYEEFTLILSNWESGKKGNLHRY